MLIKIKGGDVQMIDANASFSFANCKFSNKGVQIRLRLSIIIATELPVGANFSGAKASDLRFAGLF